MEDILKLKEELLRHRPVEWGYLPDFPLYMDQLNAYMTRQLIDLSDEDGLTPSMINNYSKMGILPRSEGKKYSREHIAYLTGICLLKQVLQVKEVNTLMKAGTAGGDVQELYGLTLKVLDEELTSAAGELPVTGDREDIMRSALQLAISSYTRQLACRELLKLLDDAQTNNEKKGDTPKENP